MNNWQHLLTEDLPTSIAGEWFCVRFSPDKTTGEIFNVGVVFIDQDQQCHTKLLENTNAFECLFGSLGVANIRFLLTVVEEALADNQYNISPSPHISYSPRQTAQGDSIDEILDDLYQSMISLIVTSEQETNKKRNNINTKDLRKRVNNFIKKQLPDTYQYILRKEPLLIGQGDKKISLDIPIVRCQISQKFYGTVVSADYLDEVHFIYNVEHIGIGNIASCCEILGKGIKAGISIYNPPLNSLTKKHQDQREKQLDKCLHRLELLRKNGYDIDIHIDDDVEKCVVNTLSMTC